MMFLCGLDHDGSPTAINIARDFCCSRVVQYGLVRICLRLKIMFNRRMFVLSTEKRNKLYQGEKKCHYNKTNNNSGHNNDGWSQ